MGYSLTGNDKTDICGETDYGEYRMSGTERIACSLFAAFAIYILVFIYYRSHVFCLVVCPLGMLYPRFRTRQIIKRRKRELNMQFKDMLYALSSSLSAGRPVETAFRHLPSDLYLLYPDKNTSIIREVRLISMKLEMNETIESALESFACRSHIEDIQNFVDVFRTSKRSGANMADVIRNTTNIINDRIEIRQEIETMLAERRFEQKVLNVLPPGMTLLLSVSASDYMRPVFTTASGRIVMSVALLLFVVAYIMSRNISDIKV